MINAPIVYAPRQRWRAWSNNGWWVAQQYDYGEVVLMGESLAQIMDMIDLKVKVSGQRVAFNR